MMRLLERLLHEDRGGAAGTGRDVSEAVRRHERVMREGEWTLRRAERAIREARAALPSWEELYGRGPEGEGRDAE